MTERLSGRYIKVPVPVQCDQWFENGDHPEDNCVPMTAPGGPFPQGHLSEGKVVRYFRHPSLPGDAVHTECGRTYHDHGFIDTPGGGRRVCPGDIIITYPDGQKRPIKPALFTQTHRPAPLPELAPGTRVEFTDPNYELLGAEGSVVRKVISLSGVWTGAYLIEWDGRGPSTWLPERFKVI